MTHTSWAGLVGLLLLAAAPGEPFLELSYEQAQQRAKDEGKLLLVDATASWCPPCKKMEKDTWPAEPVRAWLSEHAVAIQIDVDEEPELSRSLRIESLPTVIAFKDGAEFDRVVGYRNAEQLISWLDDVKAGKRAVDTTREKAASSAGKEQVDARYDLAKQLRRSGDHDGALREFVWLWRSTRDTPGYGGVRLSFMLSEIERLCEEHEPAREAFLEILDATDVQVTKGGVTEYDVWAEWFALSGALEENRRVIAFYEQRRDEHGRLHLSSLGRFLDGYVNDQVFEILMDGGRIGDAARMVEDLEAKARHELAASRQDLERDEKLFAKKESTLESLREFQEQSLQTKLSSLHAAALMVDQAESAATIAGLLLAEYDNAASRRALVWRAIQAGRAGPAHAAWLDEAEELGAVVADLREKLPRG